MSISFYLMLIESVGAIFMLIVPTSISLHQYSELVEQKEYNEFRLSGDKALPKDMQLGQGEVSREETWTMGDLL